MEGSLGFLFLAFLIIPLPNFFIFCTGHSQLRCIDTERQALLNFKQHLIDPSNRLSSWTARGDCCLWEGVVCHNLTGHVQQLHLRTSYPEGGFATYEQEEAFERRSMFGGKLNPSLLDLKHLNYFDLSFNNFSASPIPEFLGSMKSLTSLNLSHAGFVGLIPHQLGNLSNLNYLDLSYNDFSYTPIPSFLGIMSSLTHLDLSNAGFVGLIPHQLGNLSNLHYLNLNLESFRIYNFENSSLSGLYVNNLEWLSGLPLLQHLDMSSVYLSKASDWVQLTNTLPSLLELRLSDCQLPFIPLVVDVHNMTSLRHLDLSGNYFNSSIPNWLYSFSRLEFLNLRNSNLQGTISSAIGNLSSLTNLDFSNNQFSGTLPQNLGQLKNLVELSFSQNSISGPLPVSFGNLQSLTYLDLYSNQFNGTLPQSFGRLSKLDTFYIDSNKLKGVVSEVHFDNLTSLRTLTASGNQLTLKASQNWIPPFQLGVLSLQSWNLGPNFPVWLCSQRNLRYLDISNTRISGVVPPSFWNLSSQIGFLNLSQNLLYGEIVNSLINLPSDSMIDLSSNHFNGSLPYVSSNTIVLDLSNNSFSGSISHFLCYKMNEPKQMQLLNLGKNHLSGKIANCWMNAMATKDISDYDTSFGSSSFGSAIAYSRESLPLESALLVIKGQIREYSTILRLVKCIDLSMNNLSGEIPIEVTTLQGLQSLNLSYNLLIGSIPENIGTMGSLESIDFSVNQLSGQIPSSMSSLTFLNHLNLSNNNLTGKIPFGTQLQSFNASNYIGNKLCGPPLIDNCTTSGAKPHIDNIGCQDARRFVVDWFYVSMALGFVVGFWSACGPLLLNKKWRIMYFQFLDHMGYKLKGVVSLLPLGNLCNLREIRLSSNKWSQEISEILESLSRCLSDRLEILDLRYSQLHGHLTDELGLFKNLVKLSFEDNSISGPILVSLENLSSLTYLDFSNNQFNGTLPQNFGQLKNLVGLSFRNNSISGPIPVSFGNLSSLTNLDFSNNQFSGTLPQNFGQLSKLENFLIESNMLEVSLSFRNNSISGPLPLSLGSLSSLTHLDLSNNLFNGTVPQNFGQLSMLDTLFIDSNMLEGVVSKSHFSNLTRLTTFFAYGNRLTLNVSHDWIPPFQLEYLSLRLWNLGPKFPPWLCSQRNLWYLDISNAQISDVIPPSIWNLSSQSYYLNLSHNQINGEIPNNPSILSTSVTPDLQ
ncbi:receptor-like protein eix1 [Quercus suber]|uniref:Receptor-like protein eix1 n=1 Tax=Quercus suber TaxID=58331 RepID=A0AAW0JY92_QUESU